VKLRIPELAGEARSLSFAVLAEALNERLQAHRGWCEQRFDGPVTIDAEVYRSGDDVHFSGSLSGHLLAGCPRCLEEFDTELDQDFRFVLARGGPGFEDRDDKGVDHYVGDEVDLSPLVAEQALLAIDGSLPCSSECLGLCQRCGVNLNREACRCPSK
jgi:uncharacterized protein